MQFIMENSVRLAGPGTVMEGQLGNVRKWLRLILTKVQRWRRLLIAQRVWWTTSAITTLTTAIQITWQASANAQWMIILDSVHTQANQRPSLLSNTSPWWMIMTIAIRLIEITWRPSWSVDWEIARNSSKLCSGRWGSRDGLLWMATMYLIAWRDFTQTAIAILKRVIDYC